MSAKHKGASKRMGFPSMTSLESFQEVFWYMFESSKCNKYLNHRGTQIRAFWGSKRGDKGGGEDGKIG